MKVLDSRSHLRVIPMTKRGWAHYSRVLKGSSSRVNWFGGGAWGGRFTCQQIVTTKIKLPVCWAINADFKLSKTFDA